MKSARIGIHMGEETTVIDNKGRLVDLLMRSDLDYYLPPGYTEKRTPFVPAYGEDVVKWAVENDKMPPIEKLYVLTPEEAGKFWKSCAT
jgi:hypothetical protein